MTDVKPLIAEEDVAYLYAGPLRASVAALAAVK